MLSPFHLRAEKARRHLCEFVVQAWHVLEPGARFVDGIHVHAICGHLQAVTPFRSWYCRFRSWPLRRCKPWPFHLVYRAMLSEAHRLGR